MRNDKRLQVIELRRRRPAQRAPGDEALAEPALPAHLRPTTNGDWGPWLLALARDYQLIEHDDITGRLAVDWSGAGEHPNLAFIVRLVDRLNDLASEHNTVILLVRRSEIDATLAALDAGRLDLDVKRGVGGVLVGADLVLRAPFDLPESTRRAASNASMAMRASVLVTSWPWPTDLAGARQLLETARDYAIAP